MNLPPPQPGDPQIHICILTYGPHSDLFMRCLGSIERYFPLSFVADIRIGFNDACPASHEFAARVAQGYPCWMFRGYKPSRNVGKYPLMRRMFRSPSLFGTHVMWFDDDSFLHLSRGGLSSRGLRCSVDDWWMLLTSRLRDAHLVGAVYHLNRKTYEERFRRGWYGIRDQPWFTGRKPPLAFTDSKFVTGGWWVARKSMLQEHDWPPVELHHNGGDTLLGEMCRQQNYITEHFNVGVKINANEKGQESAAKRRGITSPPPFLDYTAGTDPLAYRKKCISAWHNFECIEYPLRPEENSCNTTFGTST